MNETLDGAAQGAGDAAPVAGEAAALLPPEQAATLLARLAEFLHAGGPVVAILLACSVVALTIVLLKLWQFTALSARDRRAGRQAVILLRRGRPAEALGLLDGRRDPVVRVLTQAIRGRQRRDLPEAMVREEVLRSGNEVIAGLRSHLSALEVIGGVAPLLGLFGTVLGMIEAFRRLAEAGNQVNPAVLSGGIWEALLTTAVGLAVAIPVVVLCNLFERRIERAAQEMENLVTQVFTQDLSSAHLASAPQDSHGPEESQDSVGFRLAAGD